MFILVLVPVLAAVVLRADTFFRLRSAAAVLPGWGREVNYLALYNRASADAQRLLRGAEVPERDRRAVIGLARARAAAAVASLDMAGRFALARRGASPSAASPDPGGDPRFDARASDVDPHHAYVEGCACEHCLTTEAELRAWADEHRAAAVEHQEGAFEVWPVAPPTVPWQLDHEPAAPAFRAGVA